MLSMKPRTLVDQSADLIIDAASEGVFLPGDRLVEADIARQLGISRVPVREALRLLESQGVVISIPYRGMRLMPVTNSTAISITAVRAALEAMAIRDCIAHADDAALAEIRAASAAFRSALVESDEGYRRADRAFHRALCEATGNATLVTAWSAIARQVAVLWSLVHHEGSGDRLADQHDAIVDAIEARDTAAALARLEEHLGAVTAIDFERALEQKLAVRGPA